MAGKEMKVMMVVWWLGVMPCCSLCMTCGRHGEGRRWQQSRSFISLQTLGTSLVSKRHVFWSSCRLQSCHQEHVKVMERKMAKNWRWQQPAKHFCAISLLYFLKYCTPLLLQLLATLPVTEKVSTCSLDFSEHEGFPMTEKQVVCALLLLYYVWICFSSHSRSLYKC